MDWEPQADLTYAAKIEVLRDYAQRFNMRTMIETGLYNGNGSGMQMRDLIDRYEVIDIRDEQVAAAKAKGAHGWTGDSAVVMPLLLRVLDHPALFWLDAHLVSEAGEENSSSVMGELDAILAWPHHSASVVLIDDLRMCGREGWPTVQEIRDKVGDVWVREEAADIMRLTPHHP